MATWQASACRSFTSLNHQHSSQAWCRVSRLSLRSFSTTTPNDGGSKVDAEPTPEPSTSANSTRKPPAETQGTLKSRKRVSQRNQKRVTRKAHVIPAHNLAPLGRPGNNLEVVRETWAKEPWADVANTHQEPEEAEGSVIRKEAIRDRTSSPLRDVKPITPQLPIDQLRHGLCRVLFNPGVHWLQDPRSKVYNFTPWLEKIPKPNSFAFEKLTAFISSSKDTELRDIAKREKVQFVGSTSSLSGALCHIYYLLSQFHPLNLGRFSRYLGSQPRKFPAMQRKPVTIRLVYDQGVYSIDSVRDPLDVPEKNILVWLGTLMENFLTKSSDKFKKLLRLDGPVEAPEASPKSKGSTGDEPVEVQETSAEASPDPKANTADKPVEAQEASPEALSSPMENTGNAPTTGAIKPVDPRRPAYRYAKGKNIITRSQLDCVDPRLPGRGVFDIKTRACVSIRMDILNFEESSGYLIEQQHGLMQSFEREYYDLIRSAFLKYNFQVRIGDMDGVFVAYHNTERIFGFQYIPITEIDESLFGLGEGIGDKVFKKCMTILEGVLEGSAACFPNQSVDCTLKTLPSGDTMQVWVTPTEVDPSIPADERPRALLNVTVKHKLDGKPATAMECMRSSHHTWDTDYTISRSDRSLDSLNRGYRTVGSRRLRHTLPTGLTPEEGPEFMEKLNFGNQPRDPDAPVLDASAFALPTRFHHRFRSLARIGRMRTMELEKRFEGLPKIVYSNGIYTKDGSLMFGSKQYRSFLRKVKLARDAPPSTKRKSARKAGGPTAKGTTP